MGFRWGLLWVALGGGFLLAGCSLAPRYEVPQMDGPDGWRNGGAVGEVSGTQVEAGWWRAFGSEELDRLVAAALAQNQNVKASVERVAQAKAQARSALAALLPSASFSASRSERLDDNNTTAHTPASGQLSASYEVDLFGANRSAKGAADASWRASLLDHKALEITTTAEVVQAYFQLLAARDRLRLAEENARLAEETLRIVKAKFDVGAVSAMEVAQQEQQVASVRASLASLQAAEASTLSALALLEGVAPVSLTVSGISLAPLAVPNVPLAQPSRLLAQRPDIAAAEARLKGANADIGAARAAFFPSLTLGLANAITFDPASQAATLTASALQPVFQGGRLLAGLTVSEARKRELAANYRQTVLTAFKETEDALSGLAAARTRAQETTKGAQAAQEAYRIADARYKVGSVDFQTLLGAQRDFNSARDAAASARLEELNAVVTLVRVMGGETGGQVVR